MKNNIRKNLRFNSAENIEQVVWDKVGKKKSLQFAILDQINDNCKMLKDNNQLLKPQIQNLDNQLIDYSNILVNSMGRTPRLNEKKKKLDPLNPKLWLNKEGRQKRIQKNQADKEFK